MTAVMSTRERRASANRGFMPKVLGSLLVHSAAIGGALYVQSHQARPIELPNAIPVQLVALGKKRSPELLPRKVEEPPPPPPPTQGVALETGKEPEKPNPPAEKDPPKVKPNPEQKLSDAARRLLDSRESRLEAALGKIEEREGDPNGDPYGTTTDASKAATGYAATISRVLQSSYRLPETIPASQRRFLTAQVLLFIERDGTIKRFEFVEKHSNEMFMSALSALLKSLKLPPPPASEAKKLADSGLLVRFRP